MGVSSSGAKPSRSSEGAVMSSRSHRRCQIARLPVPGVKQGLPEFRTAMPMLWVPHAAICAVVMMLLSPMAAAGEEEAAVAGSGGIARPSVEELAIPSERPSGNLAPDADTREAVCLMIEAAARANDLPLEVFARVIWHGSRFQSDAVGPLTRRGQRALGIAQFMPGPASERRRLDPFDPVQALPKSAEFLNELRNQFGNLGLAAAAYNAGPRRGQGWLRGARGAGPGARP